MVAVLPVPDAPQTTSTFRLGPSMSSFCGTFALRIPKERRIRAPHHGGPRPLMRLDRSHPVRFHDVDIDRDL